MVQLEDFFRLGYNRLLMRMMDGPEASSYMEVPRDRVWQTIRGFLQSFNTKVSMFRERVDIRGLIPTGILDISHGTEYAGTGAIISSARGLKG